LETPSRCWFASGCLAEVPTRASRRKYRCCSETVPDAKGKRNIDIALTVSPSVVYLVRYGRTSVAYGRRPRRAGNKARILGAAKNRASHLSKRILCLIPVVFRIRGHSWNIITNQYFKSLPEAARKVPNNAQNVPSLISICIR
jgi:hypothetical protein